MSESDNTHWCSLANRTLVKVILVCLYFILTFSLAMNLLCFSKCQQEPVECPSPPPIPAPVPITQQLSEIIYTHVPYASNPAWQDCALSLLVGCSFYLIKTMAVVLLKKLPKPIWQNLSKKTPCEEESCASSAGNESVDSTKQVVMVDTLSKKKRGLERRLKMEAKLYSLQERLCELLECHKENPKINGKQNGTAKSIRQPLATSRKIMMKLAKRLSAIDKELAEY